MGSTTFSNAVWIPDIKTAFAQGRKQAGYEYGHGYSGSLSEKDSYVIIQSTPITQDAALKLAGQLDEDEDSRVRDKWGSGWRHPLVAKTQLSSRTVKVSLAVPGELDYEQREVALAAKVTLKPGEKVDRIDVTSTKATRKLTTTVPKGRAVTSYQVNGRGNFPSLAAARAEAVRSAKAKLDADSQFCVWPTGFVVTGRVLRESGGPLLTVAVVPTKTVYTAEVTVAVVKGTPVVAGWLFFGRASS